MPSVGTEPRELAVILSEEMLSSIHHTITEFIPSITPVEGVGGASLAKRTAPEEFADFYRRLRAKPELLVDTEHG